MADRRAEKKRETRQRISDVATAMFFERGFDAVTLDEVAEAAHVSRMTVFNYFARKEDLMLDRQDDLRLTLLRDAIRSRPEGRSPADALVALIATLRRQRHPFTRVDSATAGWWRFVAASPSLQARLHELHDEAADGLALELGGPNPDGRARLAAGLIVLVVHTARQESVRLFDEGAATEDVTEAYFEVYARGLDALRRLTG